MKILLTNDDGLNTNGMLHLAEPLGEWAEVWSIAPDRERSASSMAISIRDSLRVTQVSDRHFTVTGFPADCVNVALHLEMFPDFDLVVSGINHGVNMGDDVHYSGTVGAARHGALHGIRALAASCPIREHDGDFRRPGRFISEWLRENYAEMTPGVVYNLNYPLEREADAAAPWPETRYTRHGKRVYRDEFEESERGPDYSVFHLKLTEMGSVGGPGTDFDALAEGCVSITPLGIDSTNQREQERWIHRVSAQTEKR